MANLKRMSIHYIAPEEAAKRVENTTDRSGNSEEMIIFYKSLTECFVISNNRV